MTATANLIRQVVDAGTWRSWDEPIAEPTSGEDRVGASASEPAGGEDVDYAAALARARARTGLDEAVITGEGRIRGRRVAIVACEFGFLAGSIGVAAGERLVRGVERATRDGLPLLASPSSGGTRMQEGAAAFLQMVTVTAAVVEHKAAGLPYLVYLRHPTTGGVLASWGSLGHLTAAAPGALVGFLGPRVYEALYETPFPEGVQVAENLYAHGVVDAVVPPARIAGVAARVLDILDAARTVRPQPVAAPDDAVPDVPAAEVIRRSRRRDRPGLRALLRVAARDVIPLNGTGAGEREPGLVLALARFGEAACMVVGQDRGGQRVQPLGPAGLRVARRGIRIATDLGLPLLTVVDTPGVALSKDAEEGGLAGEIARCLADLISAPVVTVCLLLGEGAGGGALALVPADRVVAAQHAWLSPLLPEGASAVIHRTIDRAEDMAGRLRIRAVDLRAHGLVDRIVVERPDAADEREAFLRRVATTVEAEIAMGLRSDPVARRASRRHRFRHFGAG
jgi:acetyl-CoA carboxylase carboxyl transferase subunit beta